MCSSTPEPFISAFLRGSAERHARQHNAELAVRVGGGDGHLRAHGGGRAAIRHHARLRAGRRFRSIRRESSGDVRRSGDAKGTSTVTPTPSKTFSQLVLTPAGTISAFGFQTAIPYPFGAERNGYLVTDMDAGVRAAKASGADLVVAPFPDPIGLDAVIQWPGGVFMQLYWHTSAPNYPALATVPENRVYVSPDAVDRFVHDFLTFSHGSIESDAAAAPGAEIGRPNDTYRRIQIQSPFGKMVVLVTDGHLPYPYGRETTGYEVSDLTATLQKAQSAGVTILVSPVRAGGRNSAIVEFPGGYIAELHSSDTQ